MYALDFIFFLYDVFVSRFDLSRSVDKKVQNHCFFFHCMLIIFSGSSRDGEGAIFQLRYWVRDVLERIFALCMCESEMDREQKKIIANRPSRNQFASVLYRSICGRNNKKEESSQRKKLSRTVRHATQSQSQEMQKK